MDGCLKITTLLIFLIGVIVYNPKIGVGLLLLMILKTRILNKK